MQGIGYAKKTLAGDNTDTVLSGAAIVVYGYAVVSADADLQFYDGQAAYDAGTTTAFFHRAGDVSKVVPFNEGVVIQNGLYIEGAAATEVTIFCEKV